MVCVWMYFLLLQGNAGPVPSDIKVDYTESVTVVNLPLRVQKEGKQLKNLSLDQLQLTENGVQIKPRDMVEVKTPITIHFLFDLSTSAERNLYLARKAAKDLVRDMGAGDLTKVSFFSSVYQPLTEYTNNRDELDQALSLLTPVGTTALYDSISTALSELGRMSGTRILVLFSDGHDLMSGKSEDALMDQVRNLRIPIVFVRFKGKGNKAPLLEAQSAFMTALTETSGGHLVDGLYAFDRELHKAVDPYRERYLVRFEPPGPDDRGQWRSLLVQIAGCPECEVEYRRAYSLETLTPE